jgi:hypothetical protein
MSSTTNLICKPLVVAGLIAVSEKYVFGVNDMSSTGMYAAAVGASVLASGVLGKMVIGDVDNLSSGSDMYNMKTVSQRVVELSMGVGASYALNTYVIKNTFDFSNRETLKRIGVLIAAEIGGEFICDYINGRQLSYLA